MTAFLPILSVLLCLELLFCWHPWLLFFPSSNPTAKFNLNPSLFLLWNIHSIPWLCGYSPIRCWNMYWSGWLEAHSLKHKNARQSFIKALLKILCNYYKCWILCHFFSPVVAGQSCWQHDEHRILSAFLYFSPLSYSLLPYYQFCCLFFLSNFIVLRWIGLSGVVFFPLFFWLPNSTVAQLECQSKSISI